MDTTADRHLKRLRHAITVLASGSLSGLPADVLDLIAAVGELDAHLLTGHELPTEWRRAQLDTYGDGEAMDRPAMRHLLEVWRPRVQRYHRSRPGLGILRALCPCGETTGGPRGTSLCVRFGRLVALEAIDGGDGFLALGREFLADLQGQESALERLAR